MDNKEAMKQIAAIHNALQRAYVCGDNAIIVGDCLRALRGLLEQLNECGADAAPVEPRKTGNG